MIAKSFLESLQAAADAESPPPGTITQEDVKRAAVEHDVDVRSVAFALAGVPVRGRAGVRARAAASALREGRA